MSNLVVGLIVFVCVLAVVALVGHGLWLLAAGFFGAIFGRAGPQQPERPRRPRQSRCPGCHAFLLPADRDCPRCGLEVDGKLARLVERLRAAEREIEGLVERGELDPETAARVRDGLAKRVGFVLGRETAEPVPRPRAEPVRERGPIAPSTGPEYGPLAGRAEEASARPASGPLPTAAPDLPVAVIARTEPTASIEPTADPVPVTPPSPRRRRLAAVLGGFMEEKNILWGELIGGLLIVGSSIALVLTLRQTLEQIPYSSFLLAGLVTVALFFAGHYTLHYWKLAATSRGLLIISLLLVPLNLLLLATPGTAEVDVWLNLAVKGGALLAFVGLVRTAGRDLIGTDELPGPVDRRWLLALAVVGTPASQLLPPGWFSALPSAFPAWLPLVCHLLACGAALAGLARNRRRTGTVTLPESAATAVMMFVGTSVFALFAAWGLFLTRAADVPTAVRWLALPLALGAVPVLEAGLLVMRRLDGSGGLRATGTGVALAGAGLLAGGIPLAWPDPVAAMLVSLVVGVVFTRLALRESVPWFQAGAVPAFALACVLAMHGALGSWFAPADADSVSWLARQVASAPSGVTLAGFALLLAAVAEVFVRRGDRRQGVGYCLGAIAVTAIALLVANIHGVEEPRLAAVAHGVCAVGLLLANLRWRRWAVTQLGVWLLLPATLWLLWDVAPTDRPVWGLVLAAESLALALLAALLMRAVRPGAFGYSLSLIMGACASVAGAAGLLALATALLSPGFPVHAAHTGTFLVLAAAGPILARLRHNPTYTWLGSALGLVGLVHLMLSTADIRPVPAAILLALLAHATLALFAGLAFRGRPARERILGSPLRFSARLTSCLAVPLLFIPGYGLTLHWAGFAAWLATLWLVLAVMWRERGGFPAFQGALSLAAVLASLAWVQQQDWWAPSRLGPIDPRSLQACGVGLGLLSLVWVGARRVLRENQRARDLWHGRDPATDRLVLGSVVVGQLLIAAFFLEPFVRQELMAAGREFPPVPPAEYAQAFGPGAWLLLGVLTLAVVAEFRLATWEQRSDAQLVWLVLLGLAVPVVAAGGFVGEIAGASALRWGLAATFLLGSVAVWAREPLARTAARLGCAETTTPSALTWAQGLLAVAAAVVVVLTADVAQLGLEGERPMGPLAESVFSRMGWTASTVIPLVLVVVGLAGNAVRERSPGYAFAGGLVFSAAAGGGYALAVVSSGNPLDGVQQVRLGLIVAVSAATWALAWLAAERRVTGGPLLTMQVGLGLGGIALPVVFAVGWIVLEPARPLNAAGRHLGEVGWLALVPAILAAVWHAARMAPAARFHVLGLASLLGGVLVAAVASRWDEPGRWLSFHVLGGAWAVAGSGLAVAASRQGVSRVVWPEAVAVALAGMALRAGWEDPYRPHLPAGMAAFAAGLLGVIAPRLRSQPHVAASVLAIVLASVVLLVGWGPALFNGFLMAAAAGLAVGAAVWTAVGLRLRSGGEPWPRFTERITGVALVMLAVGLVPTMAGDRGDPWELVWGAAAAVVLAVGLLQWHTRAQLAPLGLFVVGLVLVGLVLSLRGPFPVWEGWSAPVALAGYATLAAVIASTTSRRPGAFARLRLPARGDGQWEWLVPAQALIGSVVLALGVSLGVHSPDLSERLASPLAVSLLVPSAFLLARVAPGDWALPLRLATLALTVLTLVVAGWSVPDPLGRVPWLERNAWALVALVASAVAFLGVRSSLPSAWALAARRVGGWATGLSLVLVVVVLVQQLPAFDPVARRTPLTLPAVVALLAAVAALIALVLRFALQPELDPLSLPERSRGVYVYLAELLLVSFFTHVRLNLPEVFLGQAVRYWTFGVMALGFAGVGLAEVFERRRLRVLATPLRRTGVLLPLIPLLAFWAKPPGVVLEFAEGTAPGLRPLLGYLEKLPQEFDKYAGLWFLAGVMYSFLAVRRGSFGWALLAALATNAGLWALFAHNGVPFALHPQAWVIPLALIVLVSEQVNRRRLRPDVSAGLRYVGIGMIYVASTADLFIAGVGQSLWLPVILAGLCVVGILAGIVLRVRAFLFLGAGFLLLDVFAMIWHAAVDRAQTWVWYVSGIVLGAAILALFAVFEKRRNDVIGVVEKVKKWD